MITDEDEAHELLGSVAEVRGAIAKPGTGYRGLGYREVLVSSLGDDERHRRAPREFAVGSTAAPDLEASGEIARRLIEAMTKHAEIRLVPHEFTRRTHGRLNPRPLIVGRYLGVACCATFPHLFTEVVARTAPFGSTAIDAS